MQIRRVTRFVVEDFSEQEAQQLRRLGWLWMSPSGLQADYMLTYGHFYTYDESLVKRTAAEIANTSISQLAPARDQVAAKQTSHEPVAHIGK